jgi:hypothetical protein
MANTTIPVELSSTPGIVDNSNATAITIDSSENVGIGTSSPSSYPVAPELVVDTGVSGGITVVSDSTSGGYGGVFFADGTTGNEQYRGFIQYNHNNSGSVDDLILGTVGTERLRIDASGNVGIGTSSPSVNTEIRGSASNGQLRLGGSTTATYANIYSDNDGVLILGADAGNNGASSYFGVEVDGTERLRIDSSGTIYGSSTTGVTRFANKNSNYVAVADDATLTLIANTAGSVFIHVYDQGSGDGGVYFVTYRGQPVLVASQGGYTFSTSDVDGSYCIIKSNSSHVITFKNRTGAAAQMAFLLSGANVF